jgi:hypothetical protein
LSNKVFEKNDSFVFKKRMENNLLDSDFNKKERNIEFLKPIMWWEKRRFYYNVAVGSIGIIGYITNWDIFRGYSISYAFFAFLYGLLVNICYTFGWAFEIYHQIFIVKHIDLKIENYRIVLFLLGTLLSMIITAGGVLAASLSSSPF